MSKELNLANTAAPHHDPAAQANGTQAAVIKVWAEVLQRTDIKPTDNFFDLGGDSLKALDVIARLQALLKLELPLIAFFEDPTISHLANAIDQLRPSHTTNAQAADTNVSSPGSAHPLPTVEKVWREVLARESIAASDNFFDLGGDSLKALEVISRLQEELKVELPMIAFFEEPTIAHLAACIEQLREEKPQAVVSAEIMAGEAPLSFAQLQYWLLEQADPLGYLYNEVRIVRIRGEFDRDLLGAALNQIARRQQALGTRLELRLEEPVQVIDRDPHLGLEFRDLTNVPANTRESTALTMARNEGRGRFNLSTDFPIRAQLLRLSSDDHVLVITVHHVATDGYSSTILFRELSSTYESLRSGSGEAQPPLARQYWEYAAAERERQGARLEKQLEFWRSQLDGAPRELPLPFDKVQPEQVGPSGKTLRTTISPAAVVRLKQLAESNGTTLFGLLTAALRLLLHRWTGEQDIVLGTVSNNRSGPGTDRMLGCFLNFLPLRNRVSSEEDAIALILREKQVILDAFAHQDCPFLEIAGIGRRTGEANPVYNVALLLQNFPELQFPGTLFRSEFLDFDADTALLDLRFIATERKGELQVACEFRAQLFEESTIASLLDGFGRVLEEIGKHPQRRISEFAIPTQLLKQAEAVRARDRISNVAISSTFTAEPIEAPLAFWMRELGVRAKFEFAPYNQVFQQLLDPQSMISRNRDGINLLLLRLTDSLRFSGELTEAEQKQKIERHGVELAAALKGRQLGATTLVCLCPAESKFSHDPGWSEFFDRVESQLASTLSRTSGIHVIQSKQILDLYPLASYEDAYADQIGHIPYTEHFFTAAATLLARRMLALQSSPKKVIVLDCDNTLWKGVCAEEGPTGVVVDAARRQLQQFMLAQVQAGMLLCLCSKNIEEDVDAVFAQNPGMLLRPEHIVARRINWEPKSTNLRALAAELELDLDSFVLVDDNPIECAEVAAQLPEVLSVSLPSKEKDITPFLRRIWAFDHWRITEEDAQRTAMYQENAGREQLRNSAATLADFIAGLRLKIDVRPMQAADLARVSQLTERTNQFNFTTIRRSEAAVEQFLQSGGNCLVVNLSDRFGDYGLVGVMFYETRKDAIAVDTLLLSCRALGRKVEHQMLARLGEIAIHKGLAWVEARFVPTKKNQPASDFLNKVGAEFRHPGDGFFWYRFPAEYAVHLHLQPELDSSGEEQAEAKPVSTGSAPGSSATQNRILLRVANELFDVDHIARAVESERATRRQEAEFVPARTPIEEIVALTWAQVLKLDRVGVHDNFFVLGGHSLAATQVVARVRQTLHAELPLGAIFEAPTVAEFTTRIEKSLKSTHETQVPSLSKRTASSHAVLSFAQKRLWFLDQLEPGNPIYNIGQMFRMRGALDVTALEHAINRVVERHDSLRSTFSSSHGEPLQVIAPELRVEVPVTDLSRLDPESREAELKKLASEQASRAFDLAQGPLLRAQLMKLDADHHALLLTTHHIISDRWSMGVFSEELAANYAAYVESKPAALRELPVQYSDFAIWQSEWLPGDAQLVYWKKQLAGAPGLLELPTDRPRPAIQSHRGAMWEGRLPNSLVRQIVRLSQSQGATLFMTLLAGFQVLLSRYSGQDDMVIGSPIANRRYTEIEPLIGFFVNTLCLRGDLSENPTFTELLAKTRDMALAAYAHQDTPFEKLVEELQPERSLSHNPIFQVMFAHQTAPMQALQLPGLELERIPVHTGTSLFDMAWFAIDVPDGLLLRIEYSTDLFDDATVARAFEHYKTLLESIVANPQQRASELSLLPPDERQKLLIEFNAADTDFSGLRAKEKVTSEEICVHNLIERAAADFPDSTALIFRNQRASYRELNERANQIARYLLRQGAGANLPIGVFLERTLDLVPALLGILKSGSAYVPLDPSYPRERLDAILRDAGAPIVLTESSLAAELASIPAKIIPLDTDWPKIGGESKENPSVSVQPQDLAYVLFTSGSTGRPKGVAIEHRSAAVFMQWAQTVFTADELEGVLFSTSACFDLSVFEMFVPLSAGGKIIIVQNALALPEAEARDEVTLINTVPSAIAELIRMNGVPESVKTINLAGEALPLTLVNTVYSSTSAEKLYNLYGPTEDTTYSTYTLVHPNQRVTIGRPIAGTEAYVLDRVGNPQPIGIPGELYLAGRGLARGYLGRADLTAERFLPNPFGSEKSPRMYKTGDLCRWLPNGTIEYLGRLDHQVKLRGFRIELGEVESVLAKHPGVRQCLVMAREDEPGGKRLVAYFVPQGAITASSDDLVAHLKLSLPEFMIPSAFVALDRFPTTPNGKIDRKALPVPEHKREAEGDYVAPGTPLEEVVAASWAEVLHLERIGRNANFFELGGHSLLATQVISRLRHACGIELPLRALFEAPTVAGLADRIAKQRRADQGMQPPPVLKLPRTGDLPLSFAQQRLWFLNQLEPNNPFYNIPQALRMRGDLSVAALEKSLGEIVRRHEGLRTTYVIHDGQPVQRISENPEIKLQQVSLEHLPEPERESAMREFAAKEARNPFDLEKGPVIRATLLRLSRAEHVLVLNTHHIASDGWSMGIFVLELRELYPAFVKGKPSPLPDLPVQYADYAVWQRQWMRGEVLEKQLAYWRKQLEGAAVLELPTDRPRPAVQSFRGDTHTVFLRNELLRALRELSRREGVTLYMTVLAAFQVLLSRYTGQDDIVVGSAIANRNYAETENLIGFFVNALAMRTQVGGNLSFRELLGRVRETALGAYAHQDLPFEQLVEEIDPERNLESNPLFQVLLVLQNAPKYQLDLAGLGLEWISVYNGSAKFDLALYVAEKDEGLQCMMEFNTDLFDSDTIVRMLGHFETLLEAAVRHPEEQIAYLPMLTAAEKQKLTKFTQAEARVAPDRCIHHLVEAQAERTPKHVAVKCEGQSLTYGELNAHANQLARYLRKQGVGPEVLVALCMDRSIEMLVGILGILKAGGAYLPIDLAYPRERLAFMIEDAKAPVVVTEQKLKEKLPQHGARILCLDRDWEAISRERTDNVASGARPENLAYVLFTSGSTGRPKGVAIAHRSAGILIQWAQTVFTPDELGGVLLSTSICFDLSIFEMFVPLSVGGKIIIVQNALALPEAEARNEVTLINTVPSAIAELIRMNAVPESVKTINLAGEALPLSLVNTVYSSTSAEKLYNLYGPTEDTTYSTYALVRPHQRVTIGRPIAGTEAYVLDRGGNPQPIGIPGELYLAGAGLARGYFGRADLTAERFLPNPFGSEKSPRMYKTGDLCRWLPNGTIEYLGRLDHQVKIRGFRIELGEIEAVLATHPAVRQSVVMAREDEPGNKQLVAYIVPDTQAATNEEAGGKWQDQQVSQWETTFDETYNKPETEQDPLFNITGWNSSYTGQPIPAEHMREWVDSTADRILALRPKRVLEIGCGTGLLLLRIAPGCERYVGTDFSRKAILRLERSARAKKLSQVSVRQATGDDFSGIGEGEFDTVIINSVAQYFPSIDYLITVLEGAARALAPGGRIFIGDNRSLPLLEAFHTSVELYQSADSLPSDQLYQRALRRASEDEELIIDPGFFHALRQRIPQISRVETELKRGRHRNEMSEFRYDAVLDTGAASIAPAPCQWLDWQERKLSPEQLRSFFSLSGPEILGITGVPNARIAAAVHAYELLKTRTAPRTAGELKSVVREDAAREAVEPEDLWKLGAELGYEVHISWPTGARDGRLNVLFRSTKHNGSLSFAALPVAPNEPFTYKTPATYANSPMAVAVVRTLVPQLRLLASGKLPEYMLPSAFVVMDSLPLTKNGKVDRRALPAPEQTRPELHSTYVAPRTPTEEMLVAIWADVLRLEKVGTQDNFFELGGHSLLASQVISRLRHACGVELPLRALFEAPTVAGLADLIAKQRGADQGMQPPPVLKVQRTGDLPLSFAQQRLWFLDQLEPGNWLYNVPYAMRLTGRLDVSALRGALNQLIARHEILRTTYGVVSDKPVQVIRPELTIELPVVDLSSMPSHLRDQEAHRLVQEESAKRFDLSTGPMVRARVFRLEENDHVFFLNTHHIATDGWSFGVMMNDLTAFYSAAVENREADLASLEIQYADYACWQRHWLQGEVLDRQVQHWKQRLRGAPPLLPLPSDRPRPAKQTFSGAVYEGTIRKNLLEDLRLLSRQQGSTIFMTLLSAFKALVHYYTRQNDVVVGTDLANRPNLQTEALIGFFVNLLALRTDLSGNPGFEELMRRVREVALTAYAHQDLPFDKLVEELSPERNLSHSPIVQVLFVQQNTPRNTAKMPGIEVGRFPLEVPSKFDMATFVIESETDVRMRWVYNPDLFDAETITRMAANFDLVLRAIVQDTNLQLDSICELLADATKEHRSTEQKKFADAGLEKLKKVRRKTVAEV